MAENAKVGIDLVADTRSLRTQLRESVQELARLQNTAGATSKEIGNAAKKAAELKDRIGDARETIAAFNPDAKFKAFGQSISGVAGAFAGAQGAMALFGVESENVQKQLLKVQGALAFSEGLNTILGSIDGFKNLALVIKTQVINSFTTLRGALIATGIGALAIGLGLLIANFDKVKEAVLKLIPGLGVFADTIGKIVDKVTDFVGITSEADRGLELYAKNSKSRKEIYERELKAMESQGASEKDLSEKRKQIVKEDINVLEAKKRNGVKLKDDETKSLADSKNDLIVIEGNYRKSVLATQKKGNDDYLKAQSEKIDKELANELSRIERINALAEGGLSPEDQKVLKVKQQLASDLILFTDNEKLKAELIKKSEEDIDVIRRKSKQTEVKELKDSKNLFDINQNDKTKTIGLVLNSMTKSISKTKEDAQNEIALSNAVKQTRIKNLGDIGNALGALSGMAEQGSALQKGLALGQIAIDTALAISSLTATSEANPTNAVSFGAAGAIQFASGLLRILANIAQAKAILSQVPGGASAGPSISVSAPVAPIEPRFTPNVPTSLDQTSINALGNVASRSYVVESDITGIQKRIRRIENSARI